MTYQKGVVTGIVLTVVVLATASGVYWLALSKPAAAAKAPPAAPPAEVTKPLKEDQIATIKLPPESMRGLALAMGVVETKPIRRLHVYSGEIAIPAGKTVIFSAPLAGTLKAPAGGVPQPGQTVKKGQKLFELLPLLTPEGRAMIMTQRLDVEGQYKSAFAQREQLESAFHRAENLFKKQTGSKRQVEEAEAAFKSAAATADAAKARLDLLAKIAANFENGTAAPIAIESPEEGMLRNISALSGQYVPAGATLFEVARLEQVWIRVPVYVGDQPTIDAAIDALIGNLAGRGDDPKQQAKPVAAPPSANATAGTVDLFYELDNRDRKYSPGQRVGVTLTERSEAKSLTVPNSAIVLDIYGGAWVYEQTAERTFVRQRVLVRYVNGDTAVLANGPPAGTKVVTAGAAELFGAETGFTK